MGDTKRVIRLVEDATMGDPSSAAGLLALVYDELKCLAIRYFRTEPYQTLQPTALVHEAYLRITQQADVSWQGRQHFFALAATMMRRVLIDNARARKRACRGGGRNPDTAASVDRLALGDALTPEDLLALDEALGELGQIDERKARVVELRYFGGLGVAEVAALLAISEPTVKRDWAVAKGWLYRRLAGDPDALRAKSSAHM